jgi:hypothetical protein
MCWINVITIYWGYVGIKNMMLIKEKTPNCLTNADSRTMVYQIILAFMFAFPLVLFLLLTTLV